MKTTYSKLIMLVAFLIFFQMEGFSQTLTLTPSNFNGYNISCFGSATGSVNLTISGGTPPYTFEWSNAATTEDLTNVPAGYYRVSVDDADTLTSIVEAEITLTQPEPLEIGEVQPYVYPNNYNVSQFGACHGTIQINVSGGVVPYDYAWSPGQQTVSNPTNLCSPPKHSVANRCHRM
ncbi:MAG: SprB repeat-containing protein [Bacteroidetes bacterium]|nr:SprB repeat-containing protein [Bacteroidota bacterium]